MRLISGELYIIVIKLISYITVLYVGRLSKLLKQEIKNVGCTEKPIFAGIFCKNLFRGGRVLHFSHAFFLP
jgi:hypothetical protein